MTNSRLSSIFSQGQVCETILEGLLGVEGFRVWGFDSSIPGLEFLLLFLELPSFNPPTNTQKPQGSEGLGAAAPHFETCSPEDNPMLPNFWV